jgi:hypothetical protein
LTQFHIPSFEGPDNYARAGRISDASRFSAIEPLLARGLHSLARDKESLLKTAEGAASSILLESVDGITLPCRNLSLSSEGEHR